MADFLTRFAIFETPEFQKRVAVALVRVAAQVVLEEVDNAIEWTRKRSALGVDVLADPEGMTRRFALLLAAYEVNPADPDEVFEARIRDGWDRVAGVTAEDQRAAQRGGGS